MACTSDVPLASFRVKYGAIIRVTFIYAADYELDNIAVIHLKTYSNEQIQFYFRITIV